MSICLDQPVAFLNFYPNPLISKIFCRSMTMPKQTSITKTLFIVSRRRQGYEPAREGQDEMFVFELYPFDPTRAGVSNTEGWALLGTEEFTVQIPDVDPREKEIEAVERAIEDYRATSLKTLQSMEERLAQLKCLEYKP